MSDYMSPQTGYPVDPTIPDNQKDEKYHQKYHDFLLGGRSVGFSGGSDYERSWNYVHGMIDPKTEHNHVIRSASGQLYPVDFINYNHIMGFVEVLIGEALQNKQHTTVKALSKTAIARKRRALAGMDIDFKLMPLYIEDQENYGLPMVREDMPQSPSDLNHKKRNYKEKGELTYHRLIQSYKDKNKWMTYVERLLEDCFVSGRCFLESMTTPYGPKIKYRDPKTVIFDSTCESPWGEDMHWIGTIEYMPLPQVIKDFALSKEQVKKLHQHKDTNAYLSINGSRVPYFIGGSGKAELVLVTDIQWKDTKRKKGLHFQSKTGTDHWHIRDIDERRKGRPKAEKELAYDIVRRCTVVGGQEVVQYGELKNQVRTADDWQKTGFTIQAYLPRWKYGRNVSIVQQLIPVQKLYDQSMYHIRLAFKRDRGRSFLGDMSVLPQGFDLRDQAYYGEVLGIIPINSAVRGTGLQYNQFQTIDMGLSPGTALYMQVAQWAKTEMEQITGISPARQGAVETGSQAVGVMDMSRKQSTLRTQRFFSGFDIFTEKFFELVIGQYKIHIGFTKEGIEDIVGDEGMEFFNSDIQWDLEDYGLAIKSEYGTDEDKAIVHEMLKFGAQNGMTDELTVALEFLMEDDPKEALASLRAYTEEKAAKEQAQLQREQEMQQQQAQMQQEAMQRNAQMNLQGKLEGEKFKADSRSKDIGRQIRSNERIAMNKGRMDLAKQISANKLKQQQAKNAPVGAGGRK